MGYIRWRRPFVKFIPGTHTREDHEIVKYIQLQIPTFGDKNSILNALKVCLNNTVNMRKVQFVYYHIYDPDIGENFFKVHLLLCRSRTIWDTGIPYWIMSMWIIFVCHHLLRYAYS